MMIFPGRKRRQLRREIAESLARTREEAAAAQREMRICSALLGLMDEQLEAATAVNDESSAREIMGDMQVLLVERDRLRAREAALEESLKQFLIAIEGIKNG